MADDQMYNVENYSIQWKPEVDGLRKNNSGDAVDDTNENTDTYYKLPGKIYTQPVVYLKKKRVYERIANVGPDFGYLAHHGFEKGKMTLTFALEDLSMMYYLCSACATTNDSPSGGLYTHVYATTTARATTPKSFNILYKLVNDDTNSTKILLYTGCIITSWTWDFVLNDQIMTTMEIEFCNIVAGTALTSPGYPAMGSVLPNLHIDSTAVTYTVGGSAYPGVFRGANIRYETGAYLHKPNNATHPTHVYNGPRTITTSIDWAPKNEKWVEDILTAPPEPETDSNIDLTLKASRNTTSDYCQWAFQNMFCVEGDGMDWGFNNYFLQGLTKYVLKPTLYEASSSLTLTEVNALNDDRYENDT